MIIRKIGDLPAADLAAVEEQIRLSLGL